jgi:hypothetical protein
MCSLIYCMGGRKKYGRNRQTDRQTDRQMDELSDTDPQTDLPLPFAAVQRKIVVGRSVLWCVQGPTTAGSFFSTDLGSDDMRDLS